MIVDSSALVAVIRNEPEATDMLKALVGAPGALMSAVTYVEAAVVIDAAKDPVASRRFEELLRAAGVEVVALTPRQAVLARTAYADFGKGSGHPAKLNLGDCFTYALASDTGEPLLYKGEDFIHTDVRSAL